MRKEQRDHSHPRAARKMRVMTLAHREAHAGHQVLQRRDSDGAPYVELYRWTLHTGPDFNPRSLRNFPMQANGAEMLRLACCLATERGVAVAGPVHDALVIVAPLDRLAEDAAVTEDAMRKRPSVELEHRNPHGFGKTTPCPHLV